MIHNIIFDLGNVLLDLEIERSRQAFRQLLGDDYDLLREYYDEHGVFLQFETGLISEEAFFDGIRTVTSRTVSNEQLRFAWNSILGHLPLHRIRMLEQLRPHYRVFLLSNTNETHMHQLDRYFRQEHQSSLDDFLGLFEKAYLSFEIKQRKPDASIYRHLIEDAGLEPQKTVFIDDSRPNVESAKTLGIRAIHHRAGEEVQEVVVRIIEGSRLTHPAASNEHPSAGTEY